MNLDLGGFLAGAATAGSRDIEQRRSNALELKMRSRLMEQELAQKQQLFDYEKASPEVTSEVGEAFNPKGNPFAQGQRASVAELGLLSGISRARASASARLGTGGDSPVSESAARIISKRYGIPLETARGLRRAEVYNITKAGSDNALDEVMSGVDTLDNLPEFYTKLKAATNDTGITGKAKRMLAQSDTKAAELAFPEIKEAEAHFTTMFQFSKGGKNLTANEKQLVRRMATSWAYGPEELNNAERQFKKMLASNLKMRMNSGQLGFAREEVVGRLNESLLKNGMSPIPVDLDFDPDGKENQELGKKRDPLGLGL